MQYLLLGLVRGRKAHANMNFSYSWLQSFFDKKLPKPEKLAEFLTLYSFEVEEVKKNREDFVLDIAVFTNRGSDCFSHIGIAREIAAILNYKLKIEDFKLIEDKKLKAKDFIAVEVKDKNACPRYTVRVVNGVKVGPSPKWIQERLRVCGLRPINNIVDITNYVMLETGQPLHSFDAGKLGGGKIIVRFAKKGEKITSLDGEKYTLDENVLVIADSKEPLAIAGIKGGKVPEIDKKTKIVVLESANFDRKIIRRCSRELDLKTDASLRFDHGIDPNLTEFAINRASALIQKIAGGKIARGIIDVYSQKACPVGSRRISFGVLPKIIKLDLKYVERLLGIKIPEQKMKSILEKLGFKLKAQSSKLKPKDKNSKLLDVEVPTRRLDVSIPEDLIEEIGRVYGYEKIPAIFPVASLIPPKRNEEIFWEDMTKDILKEAGFTEVYNYSFISDEQAKIFGIQNLIEIENPLSSEQKYLRPSLIPNLLENVEKNLNYFADIKIFELGKIFQNCKLIEKRILTGVIAAKDTKSEEEFYELKGIIDNLLQKLGISSVWYDEYKPTPEDSKFNIWQLGKCAEIKIDNEEIGFLGEISPRVLEKLGISTKITVFDIDFEKLQKLATEEHEYRSISRHPAAIRDLAVLIPVEIRIEDVLNKIETAGGKLLRDTDIFDIYEGAELPEGKKNLAFHLIFQAEDRTLKSEEIDGLMKKIIKVLEEEPEWEVRR